MVDHSGYLKIIDYGHSIIIKSELQFEKKKSVALGTPEYLSPELINELG